ncbi:MAG TPA: S24/S26 family peptidase [Burkholderiales bacterium]|nr:S24/S26 family peptidase [Burkholderiales bacterium]
MASRDLAHAVGALLRADAARIHAVASRFEPAERFLESTVTGASMGATLPPGSRIRIEPKRHGVYEPGEIIAYLLRGEVIVHRVIHRGRFGAAAGYLLARGDATVVADPPVVLANVLGPVRAVLRDGAWVAPAAARRRSLHARLVSALVLAVARVGLALSPRWTELLLTLLYRAQRAAHAVLVRRVRLRQVAPPPTS